MSQMPCANATAGGACPATGFGGSVCSPGITCFHLHLSPLVHVPLGKHANPAEAEWRERSRVHRSSSHAAC
eukprot:1588218-Lingulodinium_polyedra.AAC.1